MHTSVCFKTVNKCKISKFARFKFNDFSRTFKHLISFQALSRALKFLFQTQAFSRISQSRYEPRGNSKLLQYRQPEAAPPPPSQGTDRSSYRLLRKFNGPLSGTTWVSIMYPKIQQRQVIMNVLHPGCAPPVLWRRFEDGLAGICVLIHSCKMPRESETTGLYGG